MIKPEFGERTVDELCDMMLRTFSKDETFWCAATITYKVLCAGNSNQYLGTGRFYLYEGIIGAASSNRLIIPYTTLALPSIVANVEVHVRRQAYHPSEVGFPRDFTVNTVANSIDFTTSPSLNGLKAIVRVFKP